MVCAQNISYYSCDYEGTFQELVILVYAEYSFPEGTVSHWAWWSLCSMVLSFPLELFCAYLLQHQRDASSF